MPLMVETMVASAASHPKMWGRQKCGDVARGAQNVGTSKNVGTSSVAPKMWGRHIGRKNVGTSTECGDVIFRENVGTSVDVPTFLAGVG